MKRIIITISILMIFLTGCSSGISEEKYNDLQVRYNELQTEYNDLLKKSSELTLIEDSQGNDSFISKWGGTMLDNATSYVIDGDKSGLITTLNETDENSIDMFISMIMINIQTIPVLINDKAPRLMYVKAVNTDKLPIVEVFIDASDLGNIKTEFMASKDYIDVVTTSIESLNNALRE